MKYRDKFLFVFLRFYLFWLFFFAVTRLIFLAWNREELTGTGFSEVFAAFAHGIYLDTAMSCYLLAPVYLLIPLYAFFKKPALGKTIDYLMLLFIITISLLTIAELPIYDEWHTKLNYKALWFLGNPSEVFHTASWKQLIFGILVTGILSALIYVFYKKFISPRKPPEPRPFYFTAIYSLALPVLLAIGVRGGLQPIPIQVSDAYYSRFNVLNLASVNSTFNLFSSCIENIHADKAYTFMPSPEAAKVFSEMNAVTKDTTLHVLTTDKPNVVLVVLESWSADLVKSCGGYDSITPEFEKLASQGILFTNCYASGSLSDQGMAAVFSAFPAQPKTSVITQPTKYVHLPCINNSFRQAGYKTSFMFGGQLSYGNIRAYMYYNNFDRIIEGKDFDPSVPQGRLGAADQYLFSRQLQELSKEQQPFFAAMFTLSTHGPFDFPMEEKLHWGDKEKPYINSVLYADGCIGNFISEAKKYPWYSNTLFIFVSDHSHNSPKNWAFNDPRYRHIPLLFYGDVIKPEYRGMKYDSVASQTDLASTLLHQLDMDASAFRYSKNLFNPYTPHYAYYAFDEGFGLVQGGSHLTWSVKDNRYEFEQYASPADKNKLATDGKAFLQELTEDYFRF